VAAADGIWRRLETAGLRCERTLAGLSDEALRACGLSAQKVRYARALAAAGINYDELATVPDEAAIAALTAVPGVGRWTAEIYLMFCLGRPDVFAPGDLALQEAARLLFGLAERPKPKALAAMAEPWAPWRAVAARLLWGYYAAVRRREGVKA
jgi:DNA-3-methyladenine glycosylase II